MRGVRSGLDMVAVSCGELTGMVSKGRREEVCECEGCEERGGSCVGGMR